jgi:hypothetical protein
VIGKVVVEEAVIEEVVTEPEEAIEGVVETQTWTTKSRGTRAVVRARRMEGASAKQQKGWQEWADESSADEKDNP